LPAAARGPAGLGDRRSPAAPAVAGARRAVAAGSTYLLGLDGLSQLLAPLTKLPAAEIVSQAERAILGWAEKPIRDDLCLLVLKPR
jgi:hypothetical protein